MLIWSRTYSDPYLFAVLLTFLVFIGGILLTDSGPLEMAVHWGNGFWSLLTFSMQMVLVLVTGHALANSPLIKKFLQSIARASRTPARAIIITTFVAAVASWINWGFGLVVGALLGREMAKEIKGLDYRLLIASAYMGFLVWHGGLSGSIPLALATETDWSYEMTGGIMVGETIFSTQTLAIAIVLILTLPILARFMMPKEDEVVAIDPELLKSSDVKQEKFIPTTPAEKVENSWIISLILFVGAVIFLVHYFAGGGTLNLNIVNFIFLFAGIALHGTPRRYIMALYGAVKNSGGIILQFPFYAGIMGMMTSSGLAAVISNWFVSFSTAYTLPFFSFISGASSISLSLPAADSGLCKAQLYQPPRL